MGKLSDENFGVMNTRKYSMKKKQGKYVKMLKCESNAIEEPKLVSQTLTVSKQDGVYFLSNMNVWLLSKFLRTSAENTYALYYQQYFEALKSLHHNIYFVLHAQSFGQKDRDGKTIDEEYMKGTNFDYNRKLRSHYGSKSATRPVKNQSVANNFIKVLNESIAIVNELEKVVNDRELQSHLPNFDETHAKNKKFQNNLTAVAQALVEQLENNKIDLSIFESAFEHTKDITLKNIF